MRYTHYILGLFVCLLSSQAFAAPGDTTKVAAHTNLQMDWYNNFDTAVTFPTGSVQYRQVKMHFILGKYQCPAGSQYCGDWDYDVHTYLMTPTDTFELGRLITPYAGTGFGRFTFAWSHDYEFDVTDYQSVLKGPAVVRILYSGYSGGFTANVRFDFVEGTPARPVLGLSRVWNGGFDYGHGAVAINTALQPITATPPAGTVASQLRLNITGHGGDDNGCAEFCPNHYILSKDATDFATQDFWREDCSYNHMYPQSGTWVYNRANWCPGDLVRDFRYELAGITAETPFTLGMRFPPYTSTTNTPNTFAASYKIDGTVFHYGPYAFTSDASIEKILAPNDDITFIRENARLGSPLVRLRNNGSATITSVVLSYGVGTQMATYTWNGSLAPEESTLVTLPQMPELKLPAGSYGFTASIVSVNGAADQEPSNNSLSTTFTAAPSWPTDIIIRLLNNTSANTDWRIEDLDGNIKASRTGCPSGTVCADTVNLDFGVAYKMIVSDTLTLGYYDITTGTARGSKGGDGLSFAGSAAGYIRAYRLNSTSLALPGAMSGAAAGNFGAGFTHYFYTGWPTAVSQLSSAQGPLAEVFPNPSDGVYFVNASASNERLTYTLTNIQGAIVESGSLDAANSQKLDISTAPAGIYLLHVRSESGLSQVLRLLHQ